MLIKRSISTLLLSDVAEAVWNRGQEYAHKKKVTDLVETSDDINAVVLGTKNYEVHLYVHRGQIEYNCTCPHFKRGSTCKHIVAVAIVRDQDNDFDLPSNEEIKNEAMVDAKTAIKKMYENPIDINLDHLREASDWRKWTRPHAKLPKAPAMKKNINLPLTLKEVEAIFSRIEKWTQRRNYDMYFCPGEVVAGFCEVLDVIRSRSSVTSESNMQGIFLLCMKNADACVLVFLP
ncbi:hypothetical protein UZ36_07570 [Candidatus Nitromaritima sp. SCGC AAA799-C22]|nr:hypothetical protein UZ36_07570 [Candidatus Nitromaritima sp. SCGC AAA799-C22]